MAAVASLSAVFFGAALLGASRRWFPTLDLAIITSQIDRVGPHTPLVGAYSRYSWFHPGPLEFWVMAPFYRLLPGTSNGVLVGSAALNLLAVLASIRIAGRRGGIKLQVAASAGFLVLAHSLGLTNLVSPWNPYLPLLPFAWFLFLCWDVACGHRWSLPVAVGVGSFIVQCHIGYALPSAVLGAWAVAAFVIFSRHADRRPWPKVAAVSAVVVGVAWVGPIIEQFTHQPGNLTALWDFFVHGGGAAANPNEMRIDTGEAAGILSRELVGAPWFGRQEPMFVSVVGLPSQWLLLPVAALVGLAVEAVRRRLRDLFLGAVTALIVMVSALLALSHVLGPAYNYIVRFTWSVGMFVTVMALWGAVVLLQPVLRPLLVNPLPRRALAGVAAVVVAALAIPTLWQGRSDELPDESVGRPLTQIMAPLDEWATVHEVRAAAITAGLGCSPAASGVAVELQRRGIAIRLNGFGKIWPSEFHQDAQPSFARVALVCGAQAIENHRRLSPDDLVAKYTPTATDDQSSGVPAARDVPVGVFANAPT